MPVSVRTVGLAPFGIGIGLLCAVVMSGCQASYPEVVITNRVDDQIVLRDISYRGCLWPVTLQYGESTSPARCLPGHDRIHFKKHDICAKGRDLPAGQLLHDCSALPFEEVAADSADESAPPTWYPYQSDVEYRADYGEFHLIEITTAIQQDFSAAGPVGH